ncbi:MAG: AarF/UbiB family protein [Chloroflexi bacterium]|nr:AarF/UbiB family protein [Chloroflexota bacterium]
MNQTPFDQHANPRMLQRRARRVLWFGARMIISIVWWELILARFLGQERIQRGRIERFVKLARNFRGLAVTLGGVWIKLGQYMSTRVDLLPPPILAELNDLQDAVPPEDSALMLALIETELKKPVGQLFADIETEPLAAASFGQAHLATLPDGKRVVVKVQRPFMDDIVGVDLRSLKTIARWFKLYAPLRRRANLDALIQEFADGVWAELDYEHEAGNAERFAQNFAHDPAVRVPRTYRELSTRRVLVLENVEEIKITDYDGLTSAGVAREAVAHKLFQTYLQQIFIDGFFHADPHPGNLFVQPLDAERAHTLGIGNGTPAPGTPPTEPGPSERPAPAPAETPASGTPFLLVYVDFGMMGVVTPAYMRELKEFIIATSLKDSRRLTAAAQRMGFFLPDADTQRIEQAIGLLFDKFWGMTVSDLTNVDFADMYSFAVEFKDLLSTLPFQIPQNILYLGRAVNILSGMSTALDPKFNAWKEMQPFARDIAGKQGQQTAQDVLKEALRLARLAIQLPNQLDALFSQALNGQLEIRAQLSQSSTSDLRRLESSVSRLAWAVVFTALLICGTLLLTNQVTAGAVICFGLGVLALVRMMAK